MDKVEFNVGDWACLTHEGAFNNAIYDGDDEVFVGLKVCIVDVFRDKNDDVEEYEVKGINVLDDIVFEGCVYPDELLPDDPY